MKIRMSFYILGIGFACFCTSLSGCVRTQIGDYPPEERIALLKKGVHSDEQVARILGSPATTTVFAPPSFVYVKAMQERTAFMPPKTVERKVLVVSFDNSGKIKDIQTLSLQDGQKVSFSEQHTPTAEKELSIMEQLLGNIGRFSDY